MESFEYNIVRQIILEVLYEKGYSVKEQNIDNLNLNLLYAENKERRLAIAIIEKKNNNLENKIRNYEREIRIVYLNDYVGKLLKLKEKASNIL
jgi:hypothetical protein